MGMDVKSAYSNYANQVYQSENETEKAVKNSDSGKITAEKTDTARKFTAMDELSYLTDKFKGINFTAGNYTRGGNFGTVNTTNIVIDPRFLEKMASDPDLEKEYEDAFQYLQDFDKAFIASEAASGWQVIDKGWFVTKDGGIGGWCATRKDPNAKSMLQKMNERTEEIRQSKLEKKEAEEKKAKTAEKNKAEEEKLEELMEQKTVTVIGKSTKEVTSRMMSAIRGDAGVSSIDIKA